MLKPSSLLTVTVATLTFVIIACGGAGENTVSEEPTQSGAPTQAISSAPATPATTIVRHPHPSTYQHAQRRAGVDHLGRPAPNCHDPAHPAVGGNLAGHDHLRQHAGAPLHRPTVAHRPFRRFLSTRPGHVVGGQRRRHPVDLPPAERRGVHPRMGPYLRLTMCPTA